MLPPHLQATACLQPPSQNREPIQLPSDVDLFCLDQSRFRTWDIFLRENERSGEDEEQG